MRIVVEQRSSVARCKAAVIQPPFLRGVPAPFGRQVSTLHALPILKPVVGEAASGRAVGSLPRGTQTRLCSGFQSTKRHPRTLSIDLQE
jgi:hypothetical protein